MAILKKDGTVETNSKFKNIDWYNQGNEVIDETTPEGRNIVKKILSLSPYFILVRDDQGKVIDVLEDEERPPTEQERIEALESALLTLMFTGGGASE